MGPRDETCGNQMMQLLSNIKTGGFDIRLRQEKTLQQTATTCSAIVTFAI